MKVFGSSVLKVSKLTHCPSSFYGQKKDYKKTSRCFNQNVPSFLLKALAPSKKSRCKTAFTSFTDVQVIDIQPLRVKLQASRRFHQVSRSFCIVKLGESCEGSKFHTETLCISELSIGETCEGFFHTLKI